MFLNLHDKSVLQVIGQDADGRDIEKRFYEMRAGLVPRVKTIALPLVKSLTVLFSKKDGDRATQHREHKTENSHEVNYTILATTPEMARERHSQQTAAVEGLFAGLTSTETLDAVAEIIVDSLRDDFPNKEARAAGAKKLREDLSLPQMVPFLIGVGKANKDLFGPFADLAPDMVAGFKRKLEEISKPEASAPQKPSTAASVESAEPPTPSP